jgi:DNA-binding transcriptional MerR regulator
MASVLQEDFVTIGAAAEAVKVSAQTLRLWEVQGLLEPGRTPGGQRRYSPRDIERARQVAELRKRYGWNTAAIRTSLAADRTDGAKRAWTANRFRRARRDRGLSLKDAAARVGISPGYLSALERGESEPSSHLIARIADAYLMPMSGLAEFRAGSSAVVRADERARGVLDGGVTWEELARPGHALEPALLIVTLVFTLDGVELVVSSGDSITVEPHVAFAWDNPGETDARVLWVEQLRPDAWEASTAATKAVRRAHREAQPPPA